VVPNNEFVTYLLPEKEDIWNQSLQSKFDFPRKENFRK